MPFLSFPEAPTYTWSEQSVPLMPQVPATAAQHTDFKMLQHDVAICLHTQICACEQVQFSCTTNLYGRSGKTLSARRQSMLATERA